MNTQPEALRLAELVGGNCGAELRRLHALNQELLEALEELADLVDLIRSGDYTPDSFTTQPARAAIAKATGESA